MTMDEWLMNCPDPDMLIVAIPPGIGEPVIRTPVSGLDGTRAAIITALLQMPLEQLQAAKRLDS